MKPVSRRYVYMKMSKLHAPQEQNDDINIPGIIITSDNQTLVVTDETVSGRYRLHNSGREVQQAIDAALRPSSSSTSGLMSKEDKAKLDALEMENWDAINNEDIDDIINQAFESNGGS